MSTKYVHYNETTKAIKGFYDDYIHGTEIEATYDSEGVELTPASIDISAIPTPNFPITDLEWNTALETGADTVDDVAFTLFVTPTADDVLVQTAKDRKIKELNEVCETSLVAGFSSSALGTPHTYQSDRDDQINLIGMVLDGVDSVFKCLDVGVTDTWAYRPHSISELQTVLADGKTMKLTQLQKCTSLKSQVLAVDYTDTVTYPTVQDAITAINGIVWA